MPSFIPQKINKKQIYQQFGSLSAIETEERRFMVDSLGSVASPTDKLLILEPKIFKNVYENSCENLFTFSVYCKNNKRFLLCQNHKFMCLYNLKGSVQKSIPTKSGNDPWDIAVTTGGDLQ